MKRRLTAVLVGRLIEAFAAGEPMAQLARRFHISRARVEAAIRRHAIRRGARRGRR